jgi:hypothetical protein
MRETSLVDVKQSRRLIASLILSGTPAPASAKETPRSASPPVTPTRETSDGEAYKSSVVTERQTPVGLPIVARDNSTTIIGGVLMLGFFLSLVSYSIKKERAPAAHS